MKEFLNFITEYRFIISLISFIISITIGTVAIIKQYIKIRKYRSNIKYKISKIKQERTEERIVYILYFTITSALLSIFLGPWFIISLIAIIAFFIPIKFCDFLAKIIVKLAAGKQDDYENK
jgi:amino acid transporter